MATGEEILHNFKNICQSLDRITINSLIKDTSQVHKFDNLDLTEKEHLKETISNFSNLCKKLDISRQKTIDKLQIQTASQNNLVSLSKTLQKIEGAAAKAKKKEKKTIKESIEHNYTFN